MYECPIVDGLRDHGGVLMTAAANEIVVLRQIRDELEAENERLRDLSDDTKRLEFIIKNYLRVYSLDMSGKHTWSGVGRPIGKGTTPRKAIDAAMEGSDETT